MEILSFVWDYMEVLTELGKTWTNMPWKWVGTMQGML